MLVSAVQTSSRRELQSAKLVLVVASLFPSRRAAAKTFAKALRRSIPPHLKAPSPSSLTVAGQRPVVRAEDSLWVLSQAMHKGELKATGALENMLARLEAMTEREDDLQFSVDSLNLR